MKSMANQYEVPAASRHAVVSRRRLLRGLGVCVAVPVFESLGGASRLVAAPTKKTLAVTASGSPQRTAFVYFPNGAIPSAWWPSASGTDFALKRTLAPWNRTGIRSRLLAV